MTAEEAERIERLMSEAKDHAEALDEITTNVGFRVGDIIQVLQQAVREAEKLEGGPGAAA